MKQTVFKSASVFLAAAALAVSIAGCGNRQFLDTTYTYRKAMISMPDGTVLEGDVESWKDYSDGDQIQVSIDGVTYLVHSSNIVLMTR